MLKNIWNCEHMDMHSKYLYFVAIIINQLLCGCESWALKESSLNDLDIFLHQSIRCIMRIKWEQVKEERISNKIIRKWFYNIKDVQSLIATRPLQFIEKIVRGDKSLMTIQLLTAWVNKNDLEEGH